MKTDPVAENPLLHLGGIAFRHPQKTAYLGRVFDDTTNSYKLFWFLALLSLLRRTEDRSFSFDDIFIEMVVVAWHPVCLYRLSMGRQDKFQEVLLKLKHLSQLPANATPDAIREAMYAFKGVPTLLRFMKKYVPMRFLSPWFAEQLRGQMDSKRNRQIESLAQKSQSTPSPCPYWFATGEININELWREFLLGNMAVAQAFTEHHLALYLQSRNPNVPGVINKLNAPMVRQLTVARRFWRMVRDGLERAGQKERFRDIYSEQPLDDAFTIDHFLPWSFVTHDLLWNLTPVAASTNSKKGDAIPDIDLYLPRLARFHIEAIRIVRHEPRLLEDYVDCFKLGPDVLLELDGNSFMKSYRNVVIPQAQIAVNQGFQYGWKLRN